jgi:hypothetical protein
MKEDHKHWSQFDENLEMLEFNRLQYMRSYGEEIVSGDWGRLERLAEGAGYGHADSFLTEFGLDGSNDTPEQAAHRSSFVNFSENEYFSAIDRSENILSGVESGPGRDLARRICDAMRESYELGRAMRIKEAEEPFNFTP